MKTFREIFKILQGIQGHPLASRHKLLAYGRFFRWQVESRLHPSGKAVSFTQKTRLLVKRGMTGATGNIYTGLHEFPEMAFLLHFLRPEDAFLDIGANVGSYTVLAAAHVGCPTWAFEPVPSTFASLQTNIRLNKATEQVTALACAVGRETGNLQITSSLDTVNHVMPVQDGGALPVINVPVVAIDDTLPAGVHPALVKIDVEGFEAEVLAGMQKQLCNERLKAIIIELNGSGGRYGYSDEAIHQSLLQNGFQPFAYDPFHRLLHPQESFGMHNTTYVREKDAVQVRLKTGQAVRIFGESI